MKSRSAVLFALLLAGCVSGPRPYDGVIGYQPNSTDTGLQVTYVDEAKVRPEKILKKMTQVSTGKLQSDAAKITVKVESESVFEQAVAMSVPIPVGAVDNGISKSKGGSGPGTNMQTTLVQNEAITRNLKLRRTIASCSRN